MRSFTRATLVRAALAALATSSLVGLALAPFHARADDVSFNTDYVSTSLGGGEPFVMYSTSGHDLIYSSHEGTTHIYNGCNDINKCKTVGDACDIQTDSGFICSYDNHVNDWFSSDGGATWTKAIDNPAGTGFSDPSLTEDEGSSSIPPVDYNTGIDLANDALFATQDGGQHWITATPQCHEGDRPWLAGGQSGEVFMGTDSETSGHVVTRGTVTFDPVTHTAVGITCSTTTIADPAATTGSGIGNQLYYDHNAGPHHGDLIEPARFTHSTNSSCPATCVGIAVLKDASHADWTGSPSTSSFVQRPDPFGTNWNDLLGGRIIIGHDDTIYVVWANSIRDTATHFGCSSSGTPLPNQVLMAYTRDEGQTWSQPKVVAQMTNAVAWWPWAAAGTAGNVSVVWYQSNQPTDPDCDSASTVQGKPQTTWTIQDANIYGVDSATFPVQSVNVVGSNSNGSTFDSTHPNGVFHVGPICQTGTTCATNTTIGVRDRRVGDYFTNALDQNGCVMIASADTQLHDPTTGSEFSTSRPIFAKQTGGTSLTTGLPCAALAVSTPEVPLTASLAVIGGAAAGAAVLLRRRRQKLLG
ncbi:MAG: hypothetical protein ABR498_02070 [Candidatus Dormibacteria bacterium]